MKFFNEMYNEAIKPVLDWYLYMLRTKKVVSYNKYIEVEKQK